MDLRALISATRRIAVLGYSSNPARAGRYVPEYLTARGFTVLPVNPVLDEAGVFPRLEDVPAPVDMVLIFRRPEHVPAHLPEILALTPPPKVVWMQLGIVVPDVAKALEETGIAVVMDRCLKVDHAALFG